MRPYTEIPQLRDLLLEESYVLGITAVPGSVGFSLDMVLTPEHPDYRPPTAREQYCFRRGQLTFTGVSRLLWSSSGNPPAVDASGEEDFGQVDTFVWDEAGQVLEGSWGRMEILSSSIEVLLT